MVVEEGLYRAQGISLPVPGRAVQLLRTDNAYVLGSDIRNPAKAEGQSVWFLTREPIRWLKSLDHLSVMRATKFTFLYFLPSYQRTGLNEGIVD